MQTVSAKGLKSRRRDLLPVVFLLALALLAGLAVLSWALDRSSTDDADVAEQRVVMLPDAAENARLLDENLNHPDVLGNTALIEAGYPDLGYGPTDESMVRPNVRADESAAYPDGVMEATDVQLNRAVPLVVNPEFSFGMARTIFLEQNVMLPGDVGHLNDRALSIEEIVFLEVNTFLPDGGAVALTPPGSDHVGMGAGFTRF